ncbi:MAG: purine-nucleoside phosphorylase [Flavobacteriales bacterium]
MRGKIKIGLKLLIKKGGWIGYEINNMENTMIPTPHIGVTDKSKISKTVIMPGDPLRAKFISDNFLENVEQINSIRNMLGYTGEFKGKQVTVMGSGMGMASIGIYSHELFAFYDVENIIRVGSAGAYTASLNLYDVVISTEAYSESTFAQIVLGEETSVLNASEDINKKLIESANQLKLEYIEGRIHSSDVFYRKNFDDYKKINKEQGCLAVEMESFALFANAKATGKNAACILTISDNLVTHEATNAEERQNAFTKMMEIALNADL